MIRLRDFIRQKKPKDTVSPVVIALLQRFYPDLAPGGWRIQHCRSQVNQVWRASQKAVDLCIKRYGALPALLDCQREEQLAAIRAAELGLTAKVFVFNEAFIQEWVTGLSDRVTYDRAAELIARCHQDTIILGRERHPQRLARHYLSIGIDDQMQEKLENLQPLWDALDRGCVELVPSHCDPAPEHFLMTEDGAMLIDWEYAGMAEPYWDLAALANGFDLDPRQEPVLLQHYRAAARTSAPLSRYRLGLFRIALRFIAGCWASAALRCGHRSQEILYFRRRALDLIS